MVKMALLQILMFSVAILKVCLGVEPTTVASVAATEKIACPGTCAEETSCSVALNDTNCGDGLVCCINEDEDVTTEFADYFTTEEALAYSSPAEQEYEGVELEVQEQDEDHAETVFDSDEANEENPDYTYVYSEESDVFSLGRSGDILKTCPGVCVPLARSDECEYMASEGMCSPDAVCCLTEADIRDTSQQYTYFIENDEMSAQMKRPVPSFAIDSCPGTCVHPSHALFCEQILPQFPCPLNSKCCIKRSVEQSSKVVQCTGQCLPSRMHGYCFPPNELVMGPTTCEQGTCCMKKSEEYVQPPSIGSMQYPDVQYRVSTSDPSQVVLGHLAIDDEGTVFKVGTDGQASPLPKLARRDHMKTKFNKLLVYPRPDGHIVIYSDSHDELYQQSYPGTSYHPLTPYGDRLSPDFQRLKDEEPKPGPRKPFHTVPDESLDIQDISIEPEVDKPKVRTVKKTIKIDREAETSQQDPDAFPIEKREEIEIVIPDDDDEPPFIESKPVPNKPSVPNNKPSVPNRPPCPGSCMSYFLRFTCFKDSAIYDGFSCPGRSVCCARLQDIENQEKHLKSLSPYSQESSDFGKTALKCGVKGTKDSPSAVDGIESLPGEWCWQVAIINVQNQYICGGALIGDSWVLTAAHCVAGSVRENQAIFVRAGVTDLKSPEDNNKGQTTRVMATYIHRNFNSINLDNNIALLHLQKPVDLVDNVCVVCLPISGQMPAGNIKCSVTGYGFVSIGGEMSLKIREAQLPIIDDTECMANVTEALLNPFILPASSFCAGGQSQHDACQGDAGGPLVCEIGGHHEIIGLVSWTLGCGRNYVPSIYVKVPAFMGWIHEVLGSSLPILH